MSELFTIFTDGTITIEQFPPVFDFNRDVARMREIVGGDIEFVMVEFRGKRTCMIVNETGAIQQPPLPINEAATAIYHTYPATRDGLTPEQAWFKYPLIHGNVALLYEVELN